MLLIRLFFFSLFFFNSIYQNPQDKSIFISPLKIPLLLSANFGELRIDHFHSGIDIKTQGVTGKEVVATADGYIYRISVSPGGFGKALYIRHPSGYSTVYCHLDRFTKEIEDYVIEQQYEKRTYLISLFPSEEKFPLKQGDLIAYSGNSGSSGGAHLHYEVRKSNNELPINPILFDFGIKDNIKPVIEKLVIYPINRNTSINKLNNVRKINVSGGNGKYFIEPGNAINISGLAGFGIKSYDLLNDAFNKCAVYSIELKIDSVRIFKYVMDGFAFDESRYINSHIDYETYMREGIYVERTFVLPNDKLSTYKETVNRGTYNFNDDRVHFAEIIVKDVQDNKSSLTFKVSSQSSHPIRAEAVTDNDQKVMPFNHSNKFVSKEMSINIPSGALYDTIYFTYKSTPGTNGMLSDLHQINNIYTPLNKPCTLSIKPKTIPAGKESKMLIVQLSDDQKKSAINSVWSDGYLTAEVQSFGKYYVGIDTVPPVISANGLVKGAVLTGKKELRILISDDFSGIKLYEALIDGKWALFAYDQKINTIIYRFDEKRITKGINHNLKLKVTDNTGNTSSFSCNFLW